MVKEGGVWFDFYLSFLNTFFLLLGNISVCNFLFMDCFFVGVEVMDNDFFLGSFLEMFFESIF